MDFASLVKQRNSFILSLRQYKMYDARVMVAAEVITIACPEERRFHDR